MILNKRQIIEDIKHKAGYEGVHTKQIKMSVQEFEDVINILTQALKNTDLAYDTATRTLGEFNVH